MKYFEYAQAESFEDAASALKDSHKGNTVVMAGGTDLLGVLKDNILEKYPEKVIGLRDISDADYIKEENGQIEIGAMTRLAAIAHSAAVKKAVPMLAQAAYSVATPNLRNVATIGGNICQDVRCWFYRYPHEIGERYNCMRKGGDECYAIRGENRYHSVFGGMKTHTTPCTAGCPASTDIPAYMDKLRRGDINAAASIIMQANPIPMITSRVCAHFCQGTCNRQTSDESVAVHMVERCVGDYILEHADVFYAPPETETGKRIALVGAGPAGLAAAYYLRKEGHDVTLFDAMDEPGGCLTYAIPAYRLPKHYVHDLIEAYRKMGIKFKMKTILGREINAERLEAEYDKVFFATGAWARPVLGFDGEEFTEFGLQFLKEVNQWVRKKVRDNVLVVGGGNVAMDVAVTCKRMGAKSVTMACLEQKDEMPASAEEIARAVEEGVVIMNGYGVSRLLYEGEKISGMELVKCVSVRDDQGCFNPRYDQESLVTVHSDSVLMAVGQKVDLSFIEEKYSLAAERGLIKVEEGTQKTSRTGVFAGGDATTGPSTVVMAVCTGRSAAESIIAELGGAAAERYAPEGFLTFDSDGVKNASAVKAKEVPASERALDKEDSFTISEEACLAEAKRCMNCGCYSVSASDISPVLIALDADIITTKKIMSAAHFFTTELASFCTLDPDEVIKAVRFKIPSGYAMQYDKFRVRKAIDFAIVSMASMYKLENGVIKDVKIVLGGVAPVPIERKAMAGMLIGQKPSALLAEKAADLAVQDSFPMADNVYKVQEVRALVKKLVSAMQP